MVSSGGALYSTACGQRGGGKTAQAIQSLAEAAAKLREGTAPGPVPAVLSIRDAVALAARSGVMLKHVLFLAEETWLREYLALCGNNQCAMADSMGIHRNSLSRLLKKHKIEAGGKVRPRR